MINSIPFGTRVKSTINKSVTYYFLGNTEGKVIETISVKAGDAGTICEAYQLAVYPASTDDSSGYEVKFDNGNVAHMLAQEITF